MPIILDNYTKPSTGRFNIDLQLSYQITISAEKAKRLAGRWVRDNVTLLLRATEPTFVIGEIPLWRVPIEITFPIENGTFDVTTIDVDVQTGKIIAPNESEKRINHLLETKRMNFCSHV